MSNKRNLLNVRLTRKFHFRHLGLWVVMEMWLVLLVNVLLYFALMHQWGYAGELATKAPLEIASFRRMLIAILSVETVLFWVAIIGLAQSTSHRLSGALLALTTTCQRVAQGEGAARQQFRDYDQLEDLAKSFNSMLDEIARGREVDNFSQAVCSMGKGA